jgi:ubiquinone/menaquinone biosynthesis C-methylase UbiE
VAAVIVILYTTLYRNGGAQLRLAALTMAREKRSLGQRVRCEAVESKRDVVDVLSTLTAPMLEFHLVSHAGMYGPMFGTTAMPEQFSPHEWRTLPLKFAKDGQAYFHACRSGRWFAPFFARTLDVPAWGHHWYTTVSRRPHGYSWVSSRLREDADVYVVGQPGRKSHGWLGAVGKHVGLLPPEPMICHQPQSAGTEADYDRVALLYDDVFVDIRVRGPEFAWLDERVPAGAAVLDIGTGTGGLLRQWASRTQDRVGVDVSPAMLDCARKRDPDAEYTVIDGPTLPFDDNRFDVVTSLLSWRYVDWDPMLAEVARVLKPGGRLLVVDMVARAAAASEWPVVLRHKLREQSHLRQFPDYRAARARLVTALGWKRMLRYNPIRAEHEYRWYFESRFPGQVVDTLDVGRNTRILAIDTGPITDQWFPPQSYP